MAHPYFSLRRIALFLPALFVAGMSIGFLLGGLRLGPGLWERLVASGVIGMTCGLLGIGIELASHGRLSRVPDRWAIVVRIPLFALAGIFGYLLGRTIVFSVLFRGMNDGSSSPTLAGMIAMCALLGIIIGLSMFVYHRLRGRLEASVERLKEAEFAERELGIARALQKRLLPGGDLSGEGWRIVAMNDEAAFVAGDYYDVFPLGDGEIGIVVADVAGKGVGASLIMATAKAMLPMLAPGKTPGDALSALSERLSRDLSPREFVAIAFARVNTRTGEMLLANAGLPDPLLVRDGAVRELPVEGVRIPAGLRRGTGYESSRYELQRGDRLLIFSDGFPESHDPMGEPIGYQKAREIVAAAGGELGGWMEQIRGSVLGSGRPLSDDLTILALELSV